MNLIYLKRLYTLALPIVFVQLLQGLNGFVDTLMAGRHGAETLSQVAIGTGIIVPIIILAAGVFGGASSLTAFAFGAGQVHQKIRFFVASLLIFAGISVLALIFMSQTDVFLNILDVPFELQQGVVAYISMVSWGFPALILFWALRSWMDAIQQTQAALIATVCTVIANIPLNRVFIFGYGIVPEMGAAGSGLATGLSFLIYPLVMLIYMVRDEKIKALYRVFKSKPIMFWVHLKDIREILKVGLPIGVLGFIEGSAFCLMALILSPFGANDVAAHSIALNFSGLMFMLPFGLNLAITVLVGEFLGANQPVEVIKKLVFSGISLAMGLGFFLTLGTFLFLEVIPLIYTTDKSVISKSFELLTFVGIIQLASCLQVVMYGVLKGLKDTLVPMFSAVVIYWFIGIGLGYLLSFHGVLEIEPQGVRGAWLALTFALYSAVFIYCSRLFYCLNYKF